MALSTVTAFDGVHEGEPVPTFELKTLDGRAFSSTEGLKGAANVITFCRFDQEYSERLLKDLQQLYSDNQGAGFRVVAVCSGDVDLEKVRTLVKKLGLAFPVVLDPDRAVYGKFRVIVTPATGFIDQKGVLRFYYASYRGDFLDAARANVGFLLGKVSAKEREDLTHPKESVSPKTSPPGMHYRLGLDLLKKGDRKGAQEEFKQSWGSQPRMAEAGVELAFLMLADKNNDEALAVATEALALAPSNAAAQGVKGAVLLHTGKEKEGVELLEKALAQKPHQPSLYYEMGLWKEKQGDAQAALRYFKEGLEAALPEPGKS